MRVRTRLTRAGLSAIAAVAVGSTALAAPATTFVAPLSGDQVQTDTTWSGDATRDLNDHGKWRATVTRGTEMDVLAGTYGTEREARRAAKAEAKARNEESGFMDGPGCEPPVLC
jgi:hypothetical protein